MKLLSGLIAGILFGILLQRSRVIRYDKQIGALRLLDMTIVKFMFTTILVGMIGVHIFLDLGIIEKITYREFSWGGAVIGGLLFGIGWALIGYCPGTAWGALAEGRYDAGVGIIGMIVGALIVAELYPFLQKTVLSWGYLGSVSLPALWGINHWFIIIPFAIIVVILFIGLEKKQL
ncbi:hypothetical protein SAMN02745221_01458 [Thermosyntropha lipolytica DSM 11003]|uniref:Uncharacterized protein n=1 Tax=Thermosyntropha lipolytica DSM 11003 TaxID=1123382 RepID=A0A1M5PF14_9FIRM|nr:DUF6691 family protein [Thermosyntropha lipolytica]SHH00404.1 hypothetical protein SAMN02745221_01458 [Thermosyntropha lipolytica DSM 11003]